MERQYKFPVYGTQGGGFVREVSKNPYRYMFVEKPNCPGLDVGDFMPEGWDLIPANQAARDETVEKQVDYSIPWDQQPDPQISFDMMPDRLRH